VNDRLGDSALVGGLWLRNVVAKLWELLTIRSLATIESSRRANPKNPANHAETVNDARFACLWYAQTMQITVRLPDT